MSRRAARRKWTRRDLLRVLGGVSLAGPIASVLGEREARAAAGTAKRIIFFYFPDGVPGASQAGDKSQFHPTGSEKNFILPPVLAPLQPYQSQCVFFRGLTMGGTDSGSHPGGAKKLLTGVDGGGGRSVDQHLAQTIGKNAPFSHLYLGVQASANNASGDKYISYWSAGQTVTPIDDPHKAFALLFGGSANGVGAGTGGSGGSGDPAAAAEVAADLSVLDNAIGEVEALQAKLGAEQKVRLEAHLAGLREVEKRLKNPPQVQPQPGADCKAPVLDAKTWDAWGQNQLYDPAKFPAQLDAQMELAVLALACDLTRVVTIQCSQHTSELIMSRFAGTAMYDPNFDMRSHQASHYGAKHDPTKKEFQHFVWQRTWFVEQFAKLLAKLAARPEGNGTMLDNTVLLLCTEVSDGNTHLHHDMPMVVAGGAGGAISGGRLLQFDNHRHGDLLAGLCHAMGEKVAGYGQQSTGPLPGLLG